LKEWDTSNNVPSLQEFSPTKFIREAGRKDAGEQTKHSDAANHYAASNKAAKNGQWNYVSVSGRCQSYDSPPHRERNATKLIGLISALD